MEQWGLQPQESDAGSSFAQDNSGFLPELGDHVVESSALWPLMSATDNLATAADQFHGVIKATQAGSRRALHAPSTLNLCRAALEASARAIWILSPTDRDVRRKRAFGANLVEMKANWKYTSNQVGYLRSGKVRAPADEVKEYLEGHKALLKLHGELEVRTDEYETPPGYMSTVEKAAEWIEQNLPAHDTGELRENGLVIGSGNVYQLTSAIIHGYQWANDFFRNGNLFAVLADSFGAAVNMTECGIALFETHAQDPAGTERTRYYPSRLEPTIQKWFSRDSDSD